MFISNRPDSDFHIGNQTRVIHGRTVTLHRFSCTCGSIVGQFRVDLGSG